MKKIGIIGTENSHALAFSQLVNLPDPATGRRKYDDARVVGVYGPDLESAQNIMDEAHVDFIAEKPEDFFGRVDAMMVTSRRGSVHSGYAMPFIEKGIPVFIDKPFTSDYAQAVALARAAKDRHVPICGGSGCKYLYDVRLLRSSLQSLAAEGNFITASANFSADMDSIYDGFFFYSPHLTEIALATFGYDVKSVRAFEKNGSVIVLARYEDYDVTLNYTKDSAASSCVLFGKAQNIYREVAMSFLYENELEHFFQMLDTGAMAASYEELVKPVAVIEAILDSLKTQAEVVVR